MRDWSLFARFVLPLAWATLVTSPAPALAQHNASRIVVPESGVQILLVAPDNTSIVLMSDVGGCPGLESTRTLTFSDLGFPAAVDSVPADGSTLAPTPDRLRRVRTGRRTMRRPTRSERRHRLGRTPRRWPCSRTRLRT
jgi:hypothetical protein